MRHHGSNSNWLSCTQVKHLKLSIIFPVCFEMFYVGSRCIFFIYFVNKNTEGFSKGWNLTLGIFKTATYCIWLVTP